MAAPQRFSNGVTNVGTQNPFAQLGMLDPTRFHVFMEDFNRFDPGDWKVSRSEPQAPTSGYTQSYEEIGDGRYGVLSVVTPVEDDSYTWIQYGQDAYNTVYGEKFTLGDKKVWFKSRFKTNDADTCTVKVGLTVIDQTAPIETINADGLWFYSLDGTANLDFYTYKSSVATISDTALTTLTDDTFLTVSFYWDGSSNILYYVDDKLEGSASTSGQPTTELTPSFGIMNGSAAASTLSMDYICVIEER